MSSKPFLGIILFVFWVAVAITGHVPALLLVAAVQGTVVVLPFLRVRRQH